MKHTLKVSPLVFEAVKKNYQHSIRYDDTGHKFEVNDSIVMHEYDFDVFTGGESVPLKITGVSKSSTLAKGWVSLSFEKVKK